MSLLEIRRRVARLRLRAVRSIRVERGRRRVGMLGEVAGASSNLAVHGKKHASDMGTVWRRKED